MKKIISLVLSILMVIALMPMAMSASAEGYTYSYVIYDHMSSDGTSFSDNDLLISVDGPSLHKSANYLTGYNCMQWEKPVLNNSLTFNLKNVAKGSYSLSFTSIDHTTQYRGIFDIYINDTLVQTVDFSSTAKKVVEHQINTALVSDGTNPVSIKFVSNTPETRISKQIFLYSINLTAQADPLAVDVTMQNGAAIRLNEQNGIRFYTNVDTAKIAELINGGATVEVGTLIAPKDKFSLTNELTLNSPEDSFINVVFPTGGAFNQDYYTSPDGSFTGIVGSITNIKESESSYSATNGNIAREFIGRGYVKVTKDLKTTVSYTDYSFCYNNSRSLAYVANAYKNDPTSTYSELTQSIKNSVDLWASKYSV